MSLIQARKVMGSSGRRRASIATELLDEMRRPDPWRAGLSIFCGLGQARLFEQGARTDPCRSVVILALEGIVSARRGRAN